MGRLAQYGRLADFLCSARATRLSPLARNRTGASIYFPWRVPTFRNFWASVLHNAWDAWLLVRRNDKIQTARAFVSHDEYVDIWT